MDYVLRMKVTEKHMEMSNVKLTMQKKENPASIAELPKTDAETADYHTMETFHDHKQLYC